MVAKTRPRPVAGTRASRHGWRRLCLFFLASLTCCYGAPPAPLPQTLTIVQWNVENLFDTDDDPANPGDDEYLPGSWRRWTPEMYEIKLSHLADMIALTKGDMICLQEIENRRVLDDLRAVLRSEHDLRYPYVIHREGPDHRGIDVAMISRFPASTNHWITPVPEQRDVLIAEFKPRGAPLTLIVNHWKSRWGAREESDRKRMEIATATGAKVKQLLAQEPETPVLVIGDFNDNYDDPTPILGLGAAPTLKAFLASTPAPLLLNLHALLPPAERGTLYYRKADTWNSFDAMIASRAMLDVSAEGDTRRWMVDTDSYEVFRHPLLLDKDARPKSFRRFKNREKGYFEYRTGYSDHFPVRVRLTLRRPDGRSQ